MRKGPTAGPSTGSGTGRASDKGTGPSTGSGSGREAQATGLLMANNAYLCKFNGFLHALRLVEMTRGARLAEMRECK